jgi:twitching motility two-component system response regulator PilH
MPRHGREALAMAPALQPDVVMLPLSGAPIDGYEACRRLHGGTTTRHSRIVLVAEDGTVVDHVWAKLQGARTVLCKPYTSDKVQEMLHACARFR